MVADASNDLEHQSYLNHRNLLIAEELEQSRLYDKSALTIAGGALGLSFAVVGDLAKGGGPVIAHGLLYAGWIALVFSILSTLFSLRFAVDAWKHSIAALDAQYAGGMAPPSNEWANWVVRFNWVSALFLFAGLIALIIFGATNLVREEPTMSDKALEQRGSTPPGPPAGKPNGGSTPPTPPVSGPKAPATPPSQK